MDRARTESQSPEQSGEALDHRESVRRKAQQEKEAKELAHKQELEAARLEAFHDRLQAKQRRESESRLSVDSPAAPTGDPSLSPVRSPQPATSDRQQELPEPPWTETSGEMTVDPKSLNAAAAPAGEVVTPLPEKATMSREQKDLKELQDVLQASLECSRVAPAAQEMALETSSDHKAPDHEAHCLDLTLHPTDLAASSEPDDSAESTLRPRSSGVPAGAEPPMLSPAVAGPGHQALPAIDEQTHDSLSYSLTAELHDLKDSTLGLTKELEVNHGAEGGASPETGVHLAASSDPEPLEEPSPTAKKIPPTPAEACSPGNGGGGSSPPPTSEVIAQAATVAAIADVLEQSPPSREARSESITIGLNVSSEKKDSEGADEGLREPEPSTIRGSEKKPKCCAIM